MKKVLRIVVMAALALIILVSSAISAERVYITEKNDNGKFIYFLVVENGKAIFIGTPKDQWLALYTKTHWDTGKAVNEIQFEQIVTTAMRHMLKFKTLELCVDGVQAETTASKQKRSTKDLEGRMSSLGPQDTGKEMILDLRETRVDLIATDILSGENISTYSDKGIVYNVVREGGKAVKFTTAKKQWKERYKKDNPGADSLDVETKWHPNALRGLAENLYRLCTKELIPINDHRYLEGRLSLSRPTETDEEIGFDLHGTHITNQKASEVISKFLKR